jgi:sec-independent protein translocase protein TatB
MFDISWSEFAIIAVVALIAIGPKELPGVLRMVGQWMGKARKMAAEFQGQFREAMREAEMDDLKKSFDEVREAATGFTSGNLMTSLEKDVGNALRIDDVEKPATSNSDAPATSNIGAAATEPAAIEPPVTPAPATSKLDALEASIPETFTVADAHALASQPLAIVQENQAATDQQDAAPSDTPRDAKAS